jgi:hypothetical protein
VCQNKKAILVELKGKDVEMAITQLSATLNNETIKTPLARYKKRAYMENVKNMIFCMPEAYGMSQMIL